MFARQSAGRLQLRGRRGEGEARRDGIKLAAAPVPELDQFFRLVIAALRRVGQGGGRVAVHHHFAGGHAGAAALGFSEEGVG